MQQDGWREVECLFHAALSRPPETRPAFLDEACGGDAILRRQVEELLSKDARAGSFLERPALSEAAALAGAPAAAGGAWRLGRQYGPYHILSLLGAGGMGEVYRAHDEKLDRDVAIKTLPPEFARDPVRVARFRREARTLASLNHPNIAAIYGLDECEEGDYLVLELVEGESPHGPLRVADALDVGCQVANALEAAHGHGIVHRDLKPANLKVTPRGVVKVLDFGLAKAIAATDARAADAGPPAATAEGTVTGHILGTPGYMSPEQARGAEVDQRTDIWAFGCLLYELLTGTRAFPAGPATTGPGQPGDGPDWAMLPDDTPPEVREMLRHCLEADLAVRLDDIARARAVMQVARPPRFGGSPGGLPGADSTEAVAVLPLAYVGGDPDQEYFADGMTEALIAELSQIRALRVISRTSVMHYKRTAKTLPEIARELAVGVIVEGSVTRAGERVRITTRLVHAASDQQVWAGTYERDLRDVLRLQSDVARAIAEEIHVTLRPQERARLARARPVNVEAHEEYIRGRYHYGRVQPVKSIEHFQRAIAIDPDYAPAYGGIADAHCMAFGAAMETVAPTRSAPLARAAALKALQLDDSLAEPHVTLARVLFWHDRDPAAAERELRRATKLNPSSAMAHFHYGLLLVDVGRRGEAIGELCVALRLDPVSCWNASIIGGFLTQIGEEDLGHQQLQKAIELDPTFFFTWSALGMIHASEGKTEQALAEAEEGLRLSQRLPIALGWAGYAHGRAGQRAQALAIVDELEQLALARYVPASARAWCYVGIGDHERVLEWLERGFEERDSQLPHLTMFRAFRPLDGDARFRDLLRRLGVGPAAAA